MRRTIAAIDEAKELQATLGALQEDARDLVAELEGIARALRSGPRREPDAVDELATALASEGRPARDRGDAAWFAPLGAVISTSDARSVTGRG